MKKEEFISNLKENSIDITVEQVKMFERYYELLKEYNQRMNLTAIIEEEEVYGKHFYDSLLIMFDKELKGTVCDVGSGAGFPGLPLIIMNSDIKLNIVEPTGKKIEFLKVVIVELKLTDVKLYNERAEEHVDNYREYYDFVLSRAVAKLNILSELCLPLCKFSGEFIAMKGLSGLEEFKGAEQAIKTLGGELSEICIHNYDDQTRYNLRISKVRKTPAVYPRNYGSIKKRPL